MTIDKYELDEHRWGMGEFAQYVEDHQEEILKRAEAGESWASIERDINYGRYSGAVKRALKKLGYFGGKRVKRRLPKTHSEAKTEHTPKRYTQYHDYDDLTPYITKLVHPIMRHSLLRMLQEACAMQQLTGRESTAYKERMLLEVINRKNLADIETIEEFMRVYIELIKRTCQYEKLHDIMIKFIKLREHYRALKAKGKINEN